MMNLTRERIREDAVWVENNIPPGRAKKIALDKLEEAMIWIQRAISKPGF